MYGMIKKILLILLFLLVSIGVFAGSQQTSSTDASVIATRARYYLNDPTTWGGTQKNVWSDTMLLQWVNDGTLDIVSRTQCLEDIESETLVLNQSNYTLSTDFISIKAVIYKDSAGVEWSLQKGDLLGKDGNKGSYGFSENMTGAPGYWIQWENDVIVHPIPDSSAAGDTIDVYLIKRPSVVTATDDVLVPAVYDRALTLYVVSQAYFKDGQFAKASRFMNEYLTELDRYRSDYIEPMPKVVQ